MLPTFKEELENIRSQHRQEKADLERSKNSELDNKVSFYDFTSHSVDENDRHM